MLLEELINQPVNAQMDNMISRESVQLVEVHVKHVLEQIHVLLVMVIDLMHLLVIVPLEHMTTIMMSVQIVLKNVKFVLPQKITVLLVLKIESTHQFVKSPHQ